MSTTIKRVALVAVAALGLGVVSVAPSQAAAQLDSISVSAATASQVAGETLTAGSVVVTATLAAKKGEDTMTVTASIVSGPAYVQPVLAFKESTTATASTTSTSSVQTVTSDSASAIVQGTAKYNLYLNAPTVAGTYVVKLAPTGTPNAVATTVSITVSAKTLGWKTAFISYDTTSAVTADTTVAVSAAASTTAKARLTTAQGYGATAGSNVAADADAAAVVVSVDKGLVSKTNDYSAGAKSVSVAAATAATSNFYFFSNGDVGAATVSITVGGVAVTAKTITYKGAASALVATPTTAAPLWVTLGTNKTTTITAKDAAGSVVDIPAVTFTVTSSDTSVATATISAGVVTVVPVAVGNATITITDPSTTGAATAVTFPVHVAPVKSKVAPVISFNKTAYNVGDLITMTVSSDMGDSATATLFSTALVFSASVVVTSSANPTSVTTHAIAGGKVAYTFYAPAVSGTFTVKATTGADVDLTTAVEVSKTVDIVNTAVDAATEAAEQAAQNADDATNAALAAADAADEATAAAQDAVAAVAELSAKVNTLIKALKAQITTLTNLVIKIQKKVKA